MSNEKISAIISLIVAIMVLVANYSQWYDLTYNGQMELRNWANIFLKACMLALLVSGYFLFKK